MMTNTDEKTNNRPLNTRKLNIEHAHNTRLNSGTSDALGTSEALAATHPRVIHVEK